VAGVDADIGKSRRFQLGTQGGAVEARVHLGAGAVEGAILHIEIGKAQEAAGLQQGMKGAQDAARIRDVVQHHQAVHDLDRQALGQARLQIQAQGLHLLRRVELGDLFFQDGQHPDGTIRQQDGAKVGPQREAELARTAPVFQRAHSGVQGHFATNGFGDGLRALPPLRIVVPASGLGIEFVHETPR